MSDFKQLLDFEKELTPSFTGRLFKGRSIFFFNNRESFLPVDESTSNINEIGPSSSFSLREEGSSELTQAINGLERLVTEKTVNETEKKIRFPGGEVSKQDKNSEVVKISEVENGSKIVLEEDCSFAKLATVIFIGERPKDFKDLEKNDLLSKMILAMNLKNEKVVRIFFDKEDLSEKGLSETQSQLYSYLYNQQPRVVVVLGALCCNLFTTKKERLSRIHGAHMKLSLDLNSSIREISYFPVFHPDILNINPNMKKTAWTDLQKVMEFLNIS